MAHERRDPIKDDLLERRGRLIASLRREKGWSQHHLGMQIGCDQSTISDGERGEHDLSLRLVIRLAETLEVPVETLLVGTRTTDEVSA
jgi:transcriptional regulator with XRE-family HTH domain